MRNVKSPDTAEQPALLVTGLSGNMGRRLAAHLPDRRLVGVDLFPPQFDHPQMQFTQLDLSASDAPANLAELMTRSNVRQVVHLAFVLDRRAPAPGRADGSGRSTCSAPSICWMPSSG